MVLEKTLESPLDCKEIQPVHPKGDQSWVFTGRTDAVAETPILWPPDAKSWLIGKDPDARKNWGQEEKGMTEDEMVGWHHWLNGHEFGTLESPLDSKEIKLVNPKGNQSWIFIGKTDAEAKAPIFWPPDGKSQLIEKDSDVGKHWEQEEKGATKDEIVGWHHWFNGHEFEQAPGDSEGQGSLACWSPWGRKESDQLSDWTTTIVFSVPATN